LYELADLLSRCTERPASGGLLATLDALKREAWQLEQVEQAEQVEP
jgi:hypothetical protein